MPKQTLSLYPLSRPPYTFNGKPIARGLWNRFCTRATATEILALVQAFFKPEEKVTLSVVDGSAGDGYIADDPLDPNNPLPTDVAEFYVAGNGINPLSSIEEWAGELAQREVEPDQEAGDTNLTQVGHGENTYDVPTLGKIAVTFLPSPNGIASTKVFWVKA